MLCFIAFSARLELTRILVVSSDRSILRTVIRLILSFSKKNFEGKAKKLTVFYQEIENVES